MAGPVFCVFLGGVILAYSGYLLKVGSYTVPLRYIKAETYQITKNGQDLDSYRDTNGELHRTALQHFVYKVEFETPPLLEDSEWSSFFGNIQANYKNATEKRVSVTAFIPETGEYITQDMYIPDIPMTVYYADATTIKYNPIRLAFIGY